MITKERLLNFKLLRMGIALLLVLGLVVVMYPAQSALHEFFPTLYIGMIGEAGAETADYQCDGTDDHVQVQAALDALPSGGGKLYLLSGTYSFGATVTRAIPNVTIEGNGYSSYVTYNASTALFNDGGQSYWRFQNFRTDAGGITRTGTGSKVIACWANTTFTDDTLLDELSNVSITAATDGEGLYYDGSNWTDEASGQRTATFVVAANDASQASKDRADYLCDGTDDQVQIQAAIDALPANGGRVLLLEGNYYISSTININDTHVILQGQGQYNTEIHLSSGSNCDMILMARASVWMPFCGVKDLSLQGDKVNQTSGNGIVIAGYQASDLMIENVIVMGTKEVALVLQPGDIANARIWNVWVLNSQFEVPGGACVKVNPGVYNKLVTNLWFENCQFYGAGEQGVQLYGTGFDNDSSAIYFTNCRFEDNGQQGLRIYSIKGITCTSCVFKNNCTSSGTAEIVILDDGTYPSLYNSFIGCTLINDVATYGARIEESGDYIHFIGCDFSACTTPFQFVIGETLNEHGIVSGNAGLSPQDSRESVRVKNTSGAQRVAGDVVIASATGESYDGTQFTTTTAQGDDLVLGMVLDTIADDAFGYVLVLGKTVALKVDGTTDITIGDFLGTFTTACIAMTAAAGDMAFAIALEAYTGNDSNGVIDALLITPRKI